MTKRAKRQQGMSLLETTLTLGALSALSLGIYMVLGPASATAQAKREQDNLRDISTAVESSFGLLGSFSGVSTSRVVEDRLMPARMRDGDTIRSAWGVAVDIVPHAINRPNDSFLVAYPLTPSGVCAKLAAAVARDVFDLRVNTVSVMTANGLDIAATTAACSAQDVATMEFIYHSGLVSGTAVAAAPVVLAPDTSVGSSGSAVPATIIVANAAGAGSATTPAPLSLPPGVAATPPPTPASPAAPASSSFAATPTSATTSTPATNLTACAPSAPSTQTIYTCSAGQYGSRQQLATFSCPEAWEAPVMSSWTTVSSNCTACPTTSTETATETNVPRSQACPVGQSGTWTWGENRSRTRSVSHNCPAGTAALPAPTYGGWSEFTWSGVRISEVNTCAANCVAPAPTTVTRTSTPCPVGQSGIVTEQQTTTHTCPAPTGPFSSSSGVWTVTGSTCAPTCVAPATTTAATTRALPNQTQSIADCASGRHGMVNQTRTVTENGTITTTHACPGPTASSTTVWLGTHNFGAWTNTSNTCVACPAPAVESQTPACPAGQTGVRTEQRTVSYTCPAGTAALPAPSFGAWATVSNTCTPSGHPNGHIIDTCWAASDGDSWRCMSSPSNSPPWTLATGPGTETWRPQPICASGRSRWVFVGGGPGTAAWEECY